MTVEIKLPSGHITVIDECDADLAGFKWHRSADSMKRQRPNVYVKAWRGDKKLYLHRAIMSRMMGRELAKGEVVDHIDGCGLNNVRSNLRLATHSQNFANRQRSIRNTSGAKGVSWDKRRCKWRARIGYQGKLLHLGLFDSPEAAHKAYMEAAVQYFGEFACDGKRAEVR